MPSPKRCAHCGERATETWRLRPCAIGRWRTFPMCTACDIELNEIALRFVRHPDADKLLAEYRERKAA